DTRTIRSLEHFMSVQGNRRNMRIGKIQVVLRSAYRIDETAKSAVHMEFEFKPVFLQSLHIDIWVIYASKHRCCHIDDNNKILYSILFCSHKYLLQFGCIYDSFMFRNRNRIQIKI